MSWLGRFIFWDHPRGSWQYDVMVGLILAFIFLTPARWFRDQPKAATVVMLPAQHGMGQFWIEPELLSGVPDAEREAKATVLINQRFKIRKSIDRVQPVYDDAEQELKGYMAYTMP